MSLAATIEDKHQFHIPSEFSTKDRTVKREANNALYVPAIYLPVEATATISDDLFTLDFSYKVSESIKEELSAKNVVVKKGDNTGRIFALRANLEKANFTELRNRLQNVRSAIVESRDISRSSIQKKNYDLILTIIDKVVSKVMREKDEITQKLFTS
jgi:hypothetical protein